MQNKLLLPLLALLFLFAGKLSAQAPSDTATYRIETKDGNEYFGRIISEDDDQLVLRTDKIGDITIRKTDIKFREKIDAKRVLSGQYWSDNPQSTRYFWAPNGYGVKKGEGYYQNVWIFFNQVVVGVTDHFSIGAGMVPLFLFAGAATPVWIAPKFSIPVVKNKVNLGVGGLAGYVLGDEENGGGDAFGIVYGSSTFGSRDKNLTLGLGYGFSSNGWAQSPTITLSGMTRLSPKWYLITENYYIDAGGDPALIFSGGARAMIGKKVGLDFGLIFPAVEDMGGFLALPWLGITIPFKPKEK